MSHALEFDSETDTDAVFRCARCARIIGFNKPGIGEPSARPIDGSWAHPPNPDQWMTECEGES